MKVTIKVESAPDARKIVFEKYPEAIFGRTRRQMAMRSPNHHGYLGFLPDELIWYAWPNKAAAKGRHLEKVIAELRG